MLPLGNAQKTVQGAPVDIGEIIFCCEFNTMYVTDYATGYGRAIINRLSLVLKFK